MSVAGRLPPAPLDRRGVDRPTVAVVGAGLGGLTAALALAQAGFPVGVYEQAERLGEVGAGLTVSRGAQQVLASLGLLGELRRHASAVRSNAFLHYRTGALIDGAPDHSDGTVDPDAAPTNLHMHRADLHGILVAALEARAPGSVHLGRRLVGVDRAGAGVRLLLEDRPPVDADLAVGADGLRSTVRAALWGERQPRFTGQVAYRCLVPTSLARRHLGAGRAGVYYGPDRVFNRYTLRGATVVNCVAIARTDTWRGESYSSPATTAELVALYRDWHPDVVGLLEAAPQEELRKWALYDRDPLPRWGSGAVTLVGDAAHPMLPFLGLGAAMAIEDGVVLARCLAADPGPTGLERYESLRRPRTTDVMLASRQEGRLVQARDPATFVPAHAPSRNATFYDFDLATVVA